MLKSYENTYYPSCKGAFFKKVTLFSLVLAFMLSTLSFNPNAGPSALAASEQIKATGNWNDTDEKGNYKYADFSWYDPSKEEFTLTNEEDLAGFMVLVNNIGEEVEDKNNNQEIGDDFVGQKINLELSEGKEYLDLGAHYWVPIGLGNNDENNPTNMFRGSFDGSNYTIKNMKIGESKENPSNYNCAGLFGCINSGSITNLKIGENSHVYVSETYAGGIAGQALGATIDNCSNSADIDGLYAGGIVGQAFITTINNCSNSKVVIGTYVGSIVGQALYTTVSNCSNSEVIIGIYTGGIIGFADKNTTIINCINSGDVSSENIAGGIAGSSSDTTIVNCSSGGEIDGTYAGGIVSQAFDTTINNCSSNGNVNGTYSGGIIGKASDITVDNTYYQIDTANKGIGNGNDEQGKVTAAPSYQMQAVSGEKDKEDWTEIVVNGTNSGKIALVDALNLGTRLYNQANPEIKAFLWNQNNDINSGYPYLNLLKNPDEQLEGWVEAEFKITEIPLWYYYENREKVSGFKEIDSKTYYFDAEKESIMQTGWLEIKNEDGSKDWYYFDVQNEKGELYKNPEEGLGMMKKDDWDQDGGKDKYYFDSDGKMVRGWRDINGARYYFNPVLGDDDADGAMVENWEKIEGEWYYFYEDTKENQEAGIVGQLAKNMWEKGNDGNWYYVGSDGKELKGWQQIDGAKYYLDTDGKMVTGWKDIDGARYYFNEEVGDGDDDGKMVTNWQKIRGEWYYFYEDTEENQVAGKVGHLAKSMWKKGNDSYWYYVGPAGKELKGWQQIEGKWYYLGTDGKMRTGWQGIDKAWYYLGIDGKMKTGWQEIDGVWYYLGTDGKMKTDWQNIDNNKYYFQVNGKMTTDKWQPNTDGYEYYLDKKGKAIYKRKRNKLKTMIYYNMKGSLLTGKNDPIGKFFAGLKV